MSKSNYDKFPLWPCRGFKDCWQGWASVTDALYAAIDRASAGRTQFVVAIECYTGLHEDEVEGALRRGLRADHFLTTAQAFKTPDEIDALAAPFLGGDDPIFGSSRPWKWKLFLTR